MATSPTTSTTQTNPFATAANAFTPQQGQQTGAEQTVASWVSPYVGDMLGKTMGVTQAPYQTYQGPLTAGESPLQQQAFNAVGNLSTPSALGQAENIFGDVSKSAAGAAYSPTQFGNQFQSPGAYQSGTFDSGFNFQAPTSSTVFGNQFAAPKDYQAGTFQGGIFGLPQAQQYMNPYLQTALNPMMEEARRQAQITRMNDAGRLAQAGAYGGSRQAIMESELNRNLMTKQNEMLTQGYNTAYDKAANIFGQDAARALQAQQMGEQSRQFGAGQGMQAAQLAAQYGLEGLRAAEQARQFNTQTGLQSAQSAAQMRLDAQKAAEASRQFGAQQGMQGAQLGAQYGLAGLEASERAKQFGADYGLRNLGLQMQAGQGLAGLGAAQGAEQRANLAQLLGAGAQQRAIEAEGVAADKAEFERQRDYPMDMLKFQSAMLQGLPIQAVNYEYQQPSAITNFLNTTGGLASLYEKLFGPAPK